jgi:hypothetical protein
VLGWCRGCGVDHGKAPQGGAAAVLVDGTRAVLIGGYGADYDLATPVSIDARVSTWPASSPA